MRITVHTVYENLSPEDVKHFSKSVFDTSWAAKEFSKEQIKEMKRDFMKGETVAGQTQDPEGKALVTTKWKLDL